jgi:hypothetical protein
MENVGQPHRVQQAEHLRRIGALHFVRISRGTLQYHGPEGRDDHGRDQQNHAGFNRAQRLPRSANCGVNSSGHICPFLALSQCTFCATVDRSGKLLKLIGTIRHAGSAPNYVVGHITQML